MTTPAAAKKATTPRKPRKLPPFVRFATPTGVPPLVAAASICMSVLRFTRANSLADLQAMSLSDPAEHGTFRKQLSLVDLTPEQYDMFRIYEPVLKLIRVKPGITVAVCPNCYAHETENSTGTAFHGWQIISGQPPAKCKVTTGCTTKPIKAVACTQIKIERDEHGDAIEPGSRPAQGMADDLDVAVTDEMRNDALSATAPAKKTAGQDLQGSFDFDNPDATAGSFGDDFTDFDDDFDPVAASDDLTDFDFD